MVEMLRSAAFWIVKLACKVKMLFTKANTHTHTHTQTKTPKTQKKNRNEEMCFVSNWKTIAKQKSCILFVCLWGICLWKTQTRILLLSECFLLKHEYKSTQVYKKSKKYNFECICGVFFWRKRLWSTK